MNLERKYEKFKLKGTLIGKRRKALRDSKSWLRIRELKKKLALKDAILHSS